MRWGFILFYTIYPTQTPAGKLLLSWKKKRTPKRLQGYFLPHFIIRMFYLFTTKTKKSKLYKITQITATECHKEDSYCKKAVEDKSPPPQNSEITNTWKYQHRRILTGENDQNMSERLRPISAIFTRSVVLSGRFSLMISVDLIHEFIRIKRAICCFKFRFFWYAIKWSREIKFKIHISFSEN